MFVFWLRQTFILAGASQASPANDERLHGDLNSAKPIRFASVEPEGYSRCVARQATISLYFSAEAKVMLSTGPDFKSLLSTENEEMRVPFQPRICHPVMDIIW